MNSVKFSVASSTFSVKPVTNSVKFNDIVNDPNVTEPLCSNIYSSNKSKNEPVYSNLKESLSFEFQGPYRSGSVFAQSAPRAVPCVDLPYLGTQYYPRPNICSPVLHHSITQLMMSYFCPVQNLRVSTKTL